MPSSNNKSSKCLSVVLSVEISKAMAKVNVNDVVEGIGRQLKLSEDSLVLSEDFKLLRFCILGFLFLIIQFAIFKGMEIWYRIPEDLLWRSAVSKKNSRFRASVVPWLMLPPIEEGSHARNFVSLSIKGMSRQINLPDANSNKWFSSKGWLMVINKDWSLYLLHTFSSLRIELPHIKTVHNWKALSTPDNAFHFINKFALSTGPSLEAEDYTLVVIYGHTKKLAYFRPGFKTWITIDSCQQIYFDVIYYQGLFYAIDFRSGITAIDIKSDNTVAAKRVAADLPLELVPPELRERFYLVESAGKILVVARQFRTLVDRAFKVYGTAGFRVVEVDLSRNKDEWSVVKNLGNSALFVGDNSSFSVQAFDNSNFKPNCIYFTDDWQDSYFSPYVTDGIARDMGFYNLQDGRLERIDTRLTCCSNCSFHPFNPPIWVEESSPLTVLPKNLTKNVQSKFPLNRSGGGETVETSSSAGRIRSSGSRSRSGGGETVETSSSAGRIRSSGSRSSGTADKPRLKQLREVGKSSFSTEGSGTPNDPMRMALTQILQIGKTYVKVYKQTLKILKEAK